MTWLKDARKSIVNGAPLMSALIAPFATLYDIPALTQPWYTLNGIKIQDPQASLILSAISLACSVAANSLLALRFTVRSPDRWRHASTASTGIWLLKTTLGVANLITFGATRRNGAGFAYDEGFFCCIMSTVLSGILTSLLLTHMIDMLVRQRQHAPGQLHLDGRVFLLAELALVALIALEALIFSRIEHWSYLDGLYFSVVTLLTIGFGDFSPSTTAGKILVFPFAIAGIALLANQISLIVSVSTRNMAKYRKQLHAIEEATVADLVKRDNEPYLQAEARRLHHITTQQRGAQDLVDLGASFAVLVVFWLVSAAIYHAAEGWPLGDALYFSYIFFLSIGYGDYSPSSPAGKTVFVFWALVAVPIMTNFVVTAIQSLVTHFSRFLTSKTSEKREEWEDVMADYFVPHPALISQAKERLDVLLQEDLDVCERCSSREDLIVVSRSDLRAALDESLILESRGRSILVDQMKAGSTAWLLLQADRNIQERYLSDVGGKDEVKEARQEAADEDILDRIAAYRQSWARWLVLGGRLMKLDEKGLSAWERRELRERDA